MEGPSSLGPFCIVCPDSKVAMKSLFRSNQIPRRTRRLVGVVALLLSAAAALNPSTAIAAGKKAQAAAKCDGLQGWSAVAGPSSTFAAGSPLGLYVWNQKGTWVIAATGPDRRQRVFQGSVTFDAAVSAKPVGLEGKSDVLSVGANSVAFTFKNFGRVDSVAITSPCATTLTVTGTVDGSPLLATQFFLGPTSVNPTTVPAILRRDASSASTVAAAAPPDAAACPTTAWPANTLGRPIALRKSRAGGFHIWNEKASGGWQAVAIADPGRPQLFEGRITANAPIVVQPIGLEGVDAVRVDGGNTVVFSFRTARGGDGFLFFAPCASQLVVDVSVDGVALTGSDVLVGSAALPAPSVPLTITR